MEKYFGAKNIKFTYGIPNHPESQSAVEAFNKTFHDYLSDCYENDKVDDIEWELELTVSGFLNFYNQKRKHTTTNKLHVEILESMMIQQYEKRLWWRQNNLIRDI